MLALAGPIAGDRVPLTNCPWVVEPKKTVARFGLAEMVLLNDFEAQSLALPGLGQDDIEPIGGGAMAADGARVVLGPGTGLGAGALVQARDMWVPVPGEGGHIDLVAGERARLRHLAAHRAHRRADRRRDAALRLRHGAPLPGGLRHRRRDGRS